MKSGKYEFISDFARRHFGEGKVEGEAEAVVKVLTARGVSLSDEHRERIMACTDLDQLNQRLERAVTATVADELFAA